MVGFISLTLACLAFVLLYRGLGLGFRQRLQLEQRLKAIREIQSIDAALLDERLRLPFLQRVFYPALRACGARLQRLAPAATRAITERRLIMAGLKLTAEQWLGWCVLASGSGMLLGMALPLIEGRRVGLVLATGLVCLLSGAYLPRLWLGQAIARRQRAILHALPDVLDLLTVSVRAGLSFDGALQRVIEKMRGPLSEELAKVTHEIRAGVLRKDALRALAVRTGVAELHGFVSTIIQADQLGVSISNVLQLQAESMRERRRQLAEERAMKAPVKMLFPLVMFIFPTLFIVLLGPALIQILTNFVGM